MLIDVQGSNLRKCLLLMSAFACIILIAFVSILVFILLTNQINKELKVAIINHNALALQGFNIATAQEPSTDSKFNEVCLTVECRDTAAAVLSKMKSEIEPCDDFYQFACGKFIDETQIPDNKEIMNTFSMLSDKLQEQLINIITEERSESEPKHFRLPNALYKACMNKTLIDNLNTEPIQQYSEALGGWPVVVGNSWNCKKTWTWQETVEKFRYLGFSTDYIINFAVKVDAENDTRNIIELDQPFIGLERQYLLNGFNNTLVSAYFDYMVDIAVMFGAKRENALIELKESLQFEMDLAKISLSSNRYFFSNLYNLRSIKELQASYPYIQWLDYINNLLPEDVTVDENEIVNVAVPRFFEDLGKLLNRTEKRVIANYMMWRIHDYSIEFLTEEFRIRQLKYDSAFPGRLEQKERWKECVDIALESFPISVSSLYVRKFFTQNSKAAVLEIANQIRKVLNRRFDEVEWMDEYTKQEAKRKLNSMPIYVGYPDEMWDNNKLKEYYNKLEIDADKYFESFLNISAFHTVNSFSQLRLPVNESDWRNNNNELTAIVNAFYTLSENSVAFSAGILQGHFFNDQRPNYMNYGAIGFIIGHEMTHGFDGTQLYNNLIWWTTESIWRYLKKAECVIKQYNNYTDKQTGFKLDGFNSVEENIADNGGVNISYLAYNQWAAKNGQEPRLPGLNYSSQQMFWISYAQTWCAKYRTEYLKDVITNDIHLPDEFRVLGSLRNMKDFSRDFQCPLGSPMNPAQKCGFW